MTRESEESNAGAQFEPIAVRIPMATRLTGMSRSRVYELIRSGQVKAVKDNGTTLIPVAELRSFVASLRPFISR